MKDLALTGKFLGGHMCGEAETKIWDWLEANGITQWYLEAGEIKGKLVMHWEPTKKPLKSGGGRR